MTEKNSTALIGAIERLAEILNGPDKWTQGTNARTADCRPVHWSHPEASSFCLIGACAKATAEGTRFGELLFDQLLTQVKKRLGKISIAKWNDAEGRTFDEVRAVIERLRSGRGVRELPR